MVRVLRQLSDGIEVEHFWLCGHCYATLDFSFDQDGTPRITTKSRLQIAADLELSFDDRRVA